jgi:hypothetical protein
MVPHIRGPVNGFLLGKHLGTIWLGSDGQELTLRRLLATNEVLNVIRRLCLGDAFKALESGHHSGPGNIATLSSPDLYGIVSELQRRNRCGLRTTRRHLHS